MKPDEKYFLKRILCEGSRDENCEIRESYKTPRAIIAELGFSINYKRAEYFLRKWGRKDWYDYGVTEDLGWLTETGIDAAKKILEEENAIT